MATINNYAISQESKQQLRLLQNSTRHLPTFRFLIELLFCGIFLILAILPATNILVTDVKADTQIQKSFNNFLSTCIVNKSCYSASGVTAASTRACVNSCVAAANKSMAASGVAAPGAASGVAASSAVAAATPSDNYDWSGDKIWFGNDILVNKVGGSTPDYFAPDGSVFVVAKDNQSTKKLSGKFTNIHLLQTPPQPLGAIEVKGMTGLPWMASWGGRNLPTELVRIAPAGKTPVDTHSEYEINKAEVESMDYARYGWALGVLTVPFKYQTSDKSISGPLSIGPYIGYRFEDYSSAIIPIFSAGLTTNIPVALANGGGTVNRSGFTYAIGLMFTINKGTGIQIGLLAGQDRLGSNSAAPYPYEGKTWVSLAVGAKVF